jgi:integrase
MTASNNRTFGVHAIARPVKTNPSLSLIYLRISLDKRRIEISLKQHIPTHFWDNKNGKVIQHAQVDPDIQTYIERSKARIWTIFKDMTLMDDDIELAVIKNKFLGIQEEAITLLSAFQYHLSTQTGILTHGTLKNYKTTEKYLMIFIRQIKKLEDVRLTKVNFQFITEFEHFLRTYKPTDHRKKMTNNGLMKHMERLQKVLNMAHKLDWMAERPMDKYRLSFVKKDRGYLDAEELAILELNPMPSARLELVRDMFIFACYSGLSYIDQQMLKPANLVLGIDGEYWIRTKRQKSSENVIVPILPKALEIIQKYREDPRSLANGTVFPPISNQKTNAYLKEIGELCGIFKHLTFHLARHTFATTITLSNGVPIETVSKMLGHTKISTTQIYSKVVERKVSEDMMALRQKLNQTDKQPLRRLG